VPQCVSLPATTPLLASRPTLGTAQAEPAKPLFNKEVGDVATQAMGTYSLGVWALRDEYCGDADDKL
jgi:hypothetical protein